MGKLREPILSTRSVKTYLTRENVTGALYGAIGINLNKFLEKLFLLISILNIDAIPSGNSTGPCAMFSRIG